MPLTVLHLTHEGRGAGSSVSIALLARAQREAGDRVLVGCPPGYLADRVREAGIDWIDLDLGAIGRGAAAIGEVAQRERVDVVNAHSSRDRAACRRLRFMGRLPAALVMTRRAMPRSTPFSALASGLAADRVIAVSHPVARALVRRGTPAGRVSVVHNALDLARVDHRPGPADTAAVWATVWGSDPHGPGAGGDALDGRPVIGVVSRRKDQEVLLRALPHLSAPLTLVCVGIERDPTLTWLAVAAEPHRVAFVPFQDDVRPFYDLFDVVVLPSRSEGLSQALMEAMALGKPVVATRAGGNTDLIVNGVHGLLVPPNDDAAMAEAIQHLLADRELGRRLGAAARERVRAAFTIERTLALTREVYLAARQRRGVHP